MAGPADSSSTETTAEVPEIGRFGALRSSPLILLAILATILFIDWAQPVLVPIVLALLVSYALAPLVDRLERLAIPRAVSAALLMAAIVVGLGATALSLRDEAVDLVETLPDAVAEIRSAVRAEWGGRDAAIEKVQRAAEEIEEAAAEATAGETPPGVTRVQVEPPRLNIRQYLWTSARDVIEGIGVALFVLLLAYFLLAAGDGFRRKWVRLSGPALSRRRITIQVMDAIRSQIQRYLGVQVLTSVIVGVASGLAFWAIGLDNAAVWGVVAGVLNLVPYIGAIVTTAGTALVAFFQFGTIGMALAVAAISVAVNGLETWLTPWLASRASRMNAVVVFSGLLFWGWLWGPWGLLLGLPIMMVVKAICDHVEDLKPIGDFMGE